MNSYITVRAKRIDYCISKTTVGFVCGTILLVAYFVGAMVGGAYLIFKFIYKPLLGLMRRKVKFNVAKWICCTLGVLIVLDTFIMAIQILACG